MASCAWISVGTYYATNLTLQWRLPLALACVGPLALLAGLSYIPGMLQLINPCYHSLTVSSCRNTSLPGMGEP
jgi:hypothetical protein